MAFKKPSAQPPVPDSPDRLFGDLSRRKHPSLYDHQGQVLRTYASEALQDSDVAFQLPTGSGKTLVGLLLAEWRRRKYMERVVYLCPTKQLVNQVADEASEKYGLSVQKFTGPISLYSPAAKSNYIDARSVAVTTYSSLFNINPFFEQPEVVILDDAHASENYIASQWTVQIRRNDEDELLFNAVAAVLKNVLSDTSYSRMVGDSDALDSATWADKLPTNTLGQIAAELHGVISENIVDSSQRYAWSMVSEHLKSCQLFVGYLEVVIRPLIPPTWTHSPFADAKQRIFMSATLGEGGDLERLTGRSDITRLAIPEGWDRQGIGRRFFVFPERSLSDEDTAQLRRDLMKEAGRSLVLTPTTESARAIQKDVADTLGVYVADARELENSREDFLGKKEAVAVVANRYDGIDFPNDDCRLLFVEGLPRAMNLQERFLMARMGASLIFDDRVQTRVLQAVGRCTRGLNDYSAVVVTGEDLPAYLAAPQRRKHLHPELQAELDFGVEQCSEVDADDIFDNFRIFLEHDTEWELANEQILEARSNVIQEPFPAMDDLATAVTHEIKWQKAMWSHDFTSAFDAAREVLGGLTSPELRGYRALWHYLAGSAAELASEEGHTDLGAQARDQFFKAKGAAPGIPWLVELAHRRDEGPTPEEKEDARCMLQVEQLEAYLERQGTMNNRNFAAREKEIREGLQDGVRFERAQVLLGEHIGYRASKLESDASPDPWWQVGDFVFVFEDHANAQSTSVIDATKARQAASHVEWIREHVVGAADASVIRAVLVTPATKARPGAMPSLGVVSYWGLNEFRDWAEECLKAIRELRCTFQESGDLMWRATAAESLRSLRADAPSLNAWLENRVAREHLRLTP